MHINDFIVFNNVYILLLNNNYYIKLHFHDNSKYFLFLFEIKLILVWSILVPIYKYLK